MGPGSGAHRRDATLCASRAVDRHGEPPPSAPDVSRASPPRPLHAPSTPLPRAPPRSAIITPLITPIITPRGPPQPHSSLLHLALCLALLRLLSLVPSQLSCADLSSAPSLPSSLPSLLPAADWCAAPPDADDDEQAAATGAGGCTAGRQAIGRCTLRQHDDALPAWGRYFAQQPSLGGRAMEDYCPLVAPVLHGSCALPDSTASATSAAAAMRGEARCEHCRCFSSSLYNRSGYVVSEGHGCFPHRCLSSSALQLRVQERWYDCRAFNDSIRVEGWTGILRCPPPHELCKGASDLAWPEISAIRPANGPARGGTVVTVYGRHMGGSVGSQPRVPTVRICGRAATEVRIVSRGGTAASNATLQVARNSSVDSAPDPDSAAGADADASADANASAGFVIAVVAVTPARPAAHVTAADARCDVRLNTSDGREALGWFTYDGMPPPSCQVLDDLDKIDWNSVPDMVSLYLCVWPFALGAFSFLSVLRLVWTVRKRRHIILRMKRRLQARQRREARVREEPL